MLNKEELATLKELANKDYMIPVIQELDLLIAQYGNQLALSYLHQAIRNAELQVMQLITERKEQGKISDVSQASKSIVGNIFPNSIIYLFLKAKEKGLIKEGIFITSKVGKFKEITAIIVDGETQKPDMDLVLYNLDKDGNYNDLIIVSLKTSLRERAGQTYKWKLLLEIATSDNPIKEKYNISYPLKRMPIVCFATVNFYNEINNPQHRGMFKFFDKSFIGKPLNADFIDNLSSLVDFANNKLG